MRAVKRFPAGSIIAIILSLGVYLGYIGLCVGMEPLARSRFRVLSKADVAAGAPQSERDRTLSRMHRWEPYVGYRIIVATMAIGGTIGAAVIARRNGAPASVVLLSAAAAFLLLAGPWFLSLQRAESSLTNFFGAMAR
jgi:hypothetical protein